VTILSSNSADSEATIFRNGKIYTADPRRAWVAAICIRGSRIVAAGDEGEVIAVAGDNARIIDLAGRMAMPGIIDMHNHVLEGARGALFELALSPTMSIAAVMEAVRAAGDKTPPGQWISGFGWGPAIAEGFATAEGLKALDAVSPSHPVVLRDISIIRASPTAARSPRRDLATSRPLPPPRARSCATQPASPRACSMKWLERPSTPPRRHGPTTSCNNPHVMASRSSTALA
jgi:hypothetical protein